MKKLLLLFSLPLVLSLVSCERMNEGNTDGNADSTANVQADNDTIVVLHDRVEREKGEYRIETQREIDSTQGYIDRMDKQMEGAGAKAKQEWQQTRSRLQPRLDRAKADLNEFGNKADNEWDEFRTKVRNNLDSLRKDWRETDVDVDVNVKQK